MGIDYAWQGGDRSCVASRQGIAAHGHKVYVGLSPMVFAAQVSLEIEKFQPEAIFVDVGYAPGVCDRLIDLGWPAMPVYFGGAPDDERFENKRAEMWWDLKEWVQVAALPQGGDIQQDFCGVKYSMRNKRGKIQLESKDSMRDRGLKSPDIGDAYALTHAFEVAQPNVDTYLHASNSATSDYDYNPLTREMN
jgi:hypothetical protein